MEVLLKKTKITSSILAQCGGASIPELINYEVLGYCMWKGSKWIVLYYKEKSDLKKFPMFKDIEQFETTPPRKPHYDIVLYDKSSFGSYRTENNEEMAATVKQILQVADEAFEKGQFYI